MIGLIRFLGHLRSIKREQWLDPESIRELQAGRLAMMAESAYSAPHYKRVMESLSISPRDAAENLASLPLTKKEAVRNFPDSFLIPGSAKSSLTACTTSGSTGMPVTVFLDREAMSYRNALGYAIRTESGQGPFDLSASIFSGAPHPHPLRRLIFREIPMSIFEREEKNFSAIRGSGANIIISYPSVIRLLARINDERGRPLRLKSVFTMGELLSWECRGIISESFSCPIFDTYGTNEFGPVAWECPEEQSLHLNAGLAVAEIVDKRGRAIRSGEGELVLSGLVNRAMPLLRYPVGDFAAWGKECPCGRGLPVLRSIKGRDDDLLRLPSGRVCSGCFIDALSDMPELRAYQLVQEKEDLLIFRFVPSGNELPAAKAKEVEALIRAGCRGEDIRVEFEALDDMPRGSTGKLATVISKVRSRGK
jgi:phenylacetate-CoA ligase